MGKYNAAPELFVSRLTAALEVAKANELVDTNYIFGSGHCFGGSAVLDFAKHG